MKPLFSPILALCALAGCSFSAGLDDLNPFSGPNSESPAAVLEDPYDRISSVESLEIGQAYQGVIVQVEGLVARRGYFSAELRLINEGQPAPDGMIELEFVARPPEDKAALSPGGGRIIAAQFVPTELTAQAAGIRILAREGSLTQSFDPR